MRSKILKTFTVLTLVVLSSLALVSNTIAQSAGTPSSPQPCSTEAHKQFDFWLGEWRVTTPDGNHVGDNSLTKIQGGCVMRESWRASTSTFTGTSFNFYNTKTEKWEQLWLDNQGGSLHMRGTRVGNQMILQTDESKNSEGKTTINKITWTKNDNGSVRQKWLVITEGQENQVAFDGLYTPVDTTIKK